MPELVVISGKGGTGKTSLVASLATLAGSVVLVDCDVDASDLHLVLEPDLKEHHAFLAGNKARIDPGRCSVCGRCLELCRFDALTPRAAGKGNGQAARSLQVDPFACEGCGVCARFCPERAIQMVPACCGDWFVSRTRHGYLVHARLDPGAGNTGRLVNQLRQRARELVIRDEELILCDGSPGIGCPVIASLTGADLALIVAEPSCSSLHDLERVLELCRHFGIEARLVLNKWDLNPGLAQQIEAQATRWNLPVIGRLRYAPEVTQAQVHRQSVVEYAPAAGVADDLRSLWQALRR